METLAHRHPSPLPVGTKIGVYQLKKVLAANWFGPLYLAWNHHLGAHAVIEEYLPRSLSLRADDDISVLPHSPAQETDFRYGLDRFLEESEMLIGIEHPNVIRTDSALHSNGTLYRVTEHIDGRDLAGACGTAGATLEEHHIYPLGLQLLEALMRVHEKGYAHGALHPACILQRANGDAVLQGFAWGQIALAARMAKLPEVLPDSYAAPEQYDLPGPPHASADLYALGATLYRCVARRDPVPASQRSAARQRGAFDPQPKAALEPTLSKYSPALLQSIDSMLSLNNADRPQSAAVVHDALKQSASAPYAAAQGPRTSGDTQSDGRKPFSTRIRHRALTGVLVVAGLAALALWLRSPEETQPITAGLDESRQAGLESRSHEEMVRHTPPAEVPSKEGSPRDDSRPTGLAKNATRLGLPVGADRTTEANNAVAQPTPGNTRKRIQPLPRPQDSSATTTAIVSPSRQSPPLRTKNSSAPKEADDMLPSPMPHRSADAALGANTGREDPAIERHLTAAKECLAALRLTTPPGDNAYEHLQAVKALAPDHPKAKAGMEAIVTRYSWLIQKALTEGRRRRARVYLKRAKQVSPADPMLEELRQALGATKIHSPGKLVR
jgi:serine/threonine protein kinase